MENKTIMENKTKEIFWCKNCVSMSTRPRITFDKNGVCNACQWSINKKKLDWRNKVYELEKLLNKYRKKDGSYDCLVPVSGGKDGSYIAYNLKHKYNMNPLCVTIRPPLTSELGDKNLQNFINSGYSLISVDPGYNAMQKLNKTGFFNMGFPYYGWLLSIFTGPPIIAEKFGIELIFYGEDGELEYGGSTELKNSYLFSADYIKEIYFERGYDKVIKKSKLSNKELFFFKFPNKNNKIKFTHWSYFEDWDPYRNYLIAKKFCGLQENIKCNKGTFTNFAQNDQLLYTLHTYLMYLKFGFGRANQDASIEVRRGAMSRRQAVNLVKLYDAEQPSEEQISEYLNYYKITKKKYDIVINKWVNKNFFKKNKNVWVPIYTIK